MTPPDLSTKYTLPHLALDDCTPPKCDKLSEYTDSTHTEAEDLSFRCMNGLDVYVRCRQTQDKFILPQFPMERDVALW